MTAEDFTPQPTFPQAATGLPPAIPATAPVHAPEQDRLDRVKSEAVKLRDTATDRARDAADSGKIRAADAIDGFAQMAHDAAARLGAQTSPQIEDYAHRAATVLDDFSESLRTKSVDELVGDLREFVKRSPAVAIGAAVAVGFALTRFAKASASNAAGAYDGGQRARRDIAYRG